MDRIFNKFEHKFKINANKNKSQHFYLYKTTQQKTCKFQIAK